jgi:hypothetical protein
MARTPVDDIANAIKDATYVSVGLGVIAFQRLQVRRNELAKAISGPAEEAKGTLEVLSAVVSERVKLVEERLGAALKR